MTKTLLFLTLAVIVAVGGWFILNKPADSQNGSESGTTLSQQDATNSRYISYSQQALAEATQDGGRALLFFHADWCPTCRAAEKDILSKIDQVPDDLTILKADYDTERELKKKYQVVVQHTFVQVDQNGNQVTKWSGGGLRDILNLIK